MWLLSFLLSIYAYLAHTHTHTHWLHAQVEPEIPAAGISDANATVCMSIFRKHCCYGSYGHIQRISLRRFIMNRTGLSHSFSGVGNSHDTLWQTLMTAPTCLFYVYTRTHRQPHIPYINLSHSFMHPQRTQTQPTTTNINTCARTHVTVRLPSRGDVAWWRCRMDKACTQFHTRAKDWWWIFSGRCYGRNNYL